MSAHGYPDWQKIQQWLGAPVVAATGLALGAGVHDDGPYNLASWASVVVAIKPTGGPVTLTVKQQVSGAPTSLELDTTFVIPAGQVAFDAVVLFGDAVTLHLAGSVGGTTVDYALYPSNTTTNAQVLASAVLNIQRNGALVAAEATLDFEDAGANVWSVVDDAVNTRVKVTPPKVLTGVVAAAGGISAGSGFTITKGAAGIYVINFTAAFAVAPVVLAMTTPAPAAQTSLYCDPPSTTAATLHVLNANTGIPFDAGFMFEAHALA